MSPPGAPAAKTERLLNLVLVLLYTRRPLTRAQIKEAVPQYGRTASDEAFQRMFERDKDELRELGIPLVTERIDPLWDDEEGYRIHERDYALPDIELQPDEMAVLGLAARAWAAASLAAPAASALRKLKAAGIERDEESLIGIEPRLRAVEAAFDPVKDAVTRQVPIRFGYRRPGAGQASERSLQPWALLSWHGRWYLSGFDLDRQAPRVFRLSRIDGPVRECGEPASYEVPPGHDIRAMVEGQDRDVTPSPAVLRVRTRRGHALRRRALGERPAGEGWDLLDVAYGDTERFADELASYGPDVVAVTPAELAARTKDRLRRVADAHAGAG